MHQRGPRLPVFVLRDVEARDHRCVNALHIQTFIPNPYGSQEGTLITFANGDTITVENGFDEIVDLMMGDRVAG
ncbi:MAG TPA: hypothetical protein VF432_08695 [Thermoanaerobaculia bacterium]